MAEARALREDFDEIPPVELPPGTVAIRVRLFESQGREMARTVRAPWPTWMERLYELEHLALRTPDPSEQPEASAGAAVTALGEHLQYRLRIAAFVVTAMEELGWRAEVDGHGILLLKRCSPGDAVVELELAGIYGPMCKVCLLDPTGLPWVGGG
jgi:hypothetical protein